MADSARAVFLSYASQDVGAARRIGEALRVAGVEVWFDQSALRGGDAWDQLIRRQIQDCAIFMPVISATTSSRHEGYFRLEWTLADQRSQMIARNRAFIVPVCLDDTPATGADVPESFQRVQWTRLPGGATPAEFVARVASLVKAPVATAPAAAVPAFHDAAPRSQQGPVARRLGGLIATGVVVLSLAAIGIWSYRHRVSALVAPPATAAALDKSIAVLSFEDMSEGHDQAYFADGLAEEVLDLLAQVPDLRVPARSSSFHFKGRNEPLAVIAKELGVAHVLEGTVRRSGSTIRVSVQLVRADTGYHVWSSIYDRDVKDVFKVQDEISAAVVTALKARLIAPGGASAHRTSVPEAYEQYLVARYLYHQGGTANQAKTVLGLRRAIQLDPGFAPAYALFAVVAYLQAVDGGQGGSKVIQEAFDAADRAVALAPDLAEAYSARGYLRLSAFEVAGAESDLERALQLDPNDPTTHRRIGFAHQARGRTEAAIASLRRAVELDPLDGNSLDGLAAALFDAGLDAEALATYLRLRAIAPTFNNGNAAIVGRLYARAGRLADARAECSRVPGNEERVCLAVIDWKEGHVDLARRALESSDRDVADVVGGAYAEVGDVDRAFAWLERAAKARARGLNLVRSTREWAAYRDDPRFIAVLRELRLLD